MEDRKSKNFSFVLKLIVVHHVVFFLQMKLLFLFLVFNFIVFSYFKDRIYIGLYNILFKKRKK